MLGISAESWGAIGTILGLAGTIATVILGRISAGDKRAHDLEMLQVGKDIERIDASQKAGWVILDELRFTVVRKHDQDKLRDELRNDMNSLGERLEKAIVALRDEIHRDRPGGA